MSYIKAYQLLSILLLIINVSFQTDNSASENVNSKSKGKSGDRKGHVQPKYDRCSGAREKWLCLHQNANKYTTCYWDSVDSRCIAWSNVFDSTSEIGWKKNLKMKTNCEKYTNWTECNEGIGCIWALNKLERNSKERFICRELRLGDLSTQYKGAEIGEKSYLEFNEWGEGDCFHVDINDNNRLDLIDGKVEKPAEVPTCFKDFHDIALKPICGHLMFNKFKYCQIGAFYGNHDYNEVDFQKIRYGILMLFDGCLICSDPNYFRKDKVNIKIETKQHRRQTFNVDSEGNFLLGMQVYPHFDKNVSIVIRHRCNLNKLVQYKIINIELEEVVDYPSRVWKSVNTVIGLEGEVKQKFTDLYGKKDLDAN